MRYHSPTPEACQRIRVKRSLAVLMRASERGDLLDEAASEYIMNKEAGNEAELTFPLKPLGILSLLW
jgi:hypothetical protein